VDTSQDDISTDNTVDICGDISPTDTNPLDLSAKIESEHNHSVAADMTPLDVLVKIALVMYENEMEHESEENLKQQTREDRTKINCLVNNYAASIFAKPTFYF